MIDLDYLVCLLPLTNETEHILNTDLFKRCHNKPYLINVARGKHLNESDLIAALNFGQISGVCLDVFVEEPLPANHPFWQDERILITPHVAAVTDVSEAAQQIVENYRRMRQSQPLINEVNREKGY